MVLDWTKDTSRRLNDDKEILPWDMISLLRKSNLTEFGKAIVLRVKETTFGSLTLEDKQGHEKFESDQEMLDTYGRYYGTSVWLNSRLKVIKFKLM